MFELTRVKTKRNGVPSVSTRCCRSVSALDLEAIAGSNTAICNLTCLSVRGMCKRAALLTKVLGAEMCIRFTSLQSQTTDDADTSDHLALSANAQAARQVSISLHGGTTPGATMRVWAWRRGLKSTASRAATADHCRTPLDAHLLCQVDQAHF